jgi:hypothetical protein
MHKRTRDRMIDGLMDAYVDWREASVDVESAYRRWARAAPGDTSDAFAGYRATLDRELLATIAYARLMRRIRVRLERDRRRRLAAGRRPVRERRRGRRRRPSRDMGARDRRTRGARVRA